LVLDRNEQDAGDRAFYERVLGDAYDDLEGAELFSALLSAPRRSALVEKHPGSKALGEALKTNRTLKTLNLYSNQFMGCAGVTALCEGLGENKGLTELDLSFCYGRETGGMSLGEALKKNRTLLTLDLTYNKVGSAGAAALSEALKTNRTLKTLNLTNNDTFKQDDDELHKAAWEGLTIEGAEGHRPRSS